MNVPTSIGQGITLTAAFALPTGAPADPSGGVTLSIINPLGVTTVVDNASLLKPGTGRYQYVLVPNTAGRWTYAFTSTGSISATTTGAITVEPVDWIPSVDDVAAILRSRTVDRDGNELGTFTSATEPTGTEVARKITQEAGALVGYVGEPPKGQWELARKVVAYVVAAELELNTWRDDRGAYNDLAAIRDSEYAHLVLAIREHTATMQAAGGAGWSSIILRSQGAIDSETTGLQVGEETPPYTPSGWPEIDLGTGGVAGTIV